MRSIVYSQILKGPWAMWARTRNDSRQSRRLARRRSSSVPARRSGAFLHEHGKMNRLHLAIEPLEPRALLATVVWDGGPSGLGVNWQDKTNWLGDSLPGQQDDVEIGAAFAGSTISSSADVTVRSVSSQAPLNIANGTFSVSANSVLQRSLAVAGGKLLVAANLNVAGLFTWSNGVLSGGGQTFAPGGVALDAANFDLKLDGHRLVNQGAAIWTGGRQVMIYNGAVFRNAAGATFEIRVDRSFYDPKWGAAATLLNEGSIRKTTGSGETRLGGLIQNQGTIEVQQGTLILDGGGDSSGVFTAAAGATLSFDEGKFNLLAGSAVNGAGLSRRRGIRPTSTTS